jgi:ABC-type Mn2+/Zn2+ transport system permease subunit
MSTISDFFAYPFIQRALLASLMVGVLCPFVGTFVVLRRMSFFSDAISHAAFAGIAVGVLLGVDLSFSSVIVAILIAFVIAFLSEKTTLSHDTVIGIAFSGAIAAGMLVLGAMKGYRADIFAFIFGDILAITGTDLLLIFTVGILTIAIILFFFKPFMQITFHRDLARVEGINVRFFEYLLFFIIAVVVTVSLKIIGIILVTSLLIVPAAAARNIASSMKGLFVLSLNTASGPTIVMVSIGIFILTMMIRKDS